jgi:predicted nucleic acid-binding protein
MRHVFIETNWVFACCAPAHHRDPTARQLLDRADGGEFRLHLPSICLREAADAIRRKCQPREVNALREFRRWAKTQGKLTESDSMVVARFLELFAVTVERELAALDETIEELRRHPGLEVFALNETMLECAISIRGQVSDLRPFDEAILAAVLVKAREVRAAGATEIHFCNLDSDLRPVAANKRRLAQIYREAGIAVQPDFLLD